MQYRAELYGLALKQDLDSNQSHTVTIVPPTITNASPSESVKTRTFKLVCYYSLPSNGTGGDLTPEEINPSLCTHINIAFAHITNGSLQPVNSTVMGLYNRIVALKSGNPSLKVLLSIAGSSEQGSFSTMTTTHASRKL
jgi:chitinase